MKLNRAVISCAPFLLIAGLIFTGCDEQQGSGSQASQAEQINVASNAKSGQSEEPGVGSGYDGPVFRVIIVEIIKSDDGKPAASVYTINTDGSRKEVLGQVARVNDGPVLVEERKIFVFVGKPGWEEEQGLWAYNYVNDSAYLLIEADVGMTEPQVSEDSRYAYVFHGGYLMQYAFETQYSKKIMELTSKDGVKISKDGRYVCGTQPGIVFRHDLKTGERKEWRVNPDFGGFVFSDDCQSFQAANLKQDLLLAGVLGKSTVSTFVCSTNTRDLSPTAAFFANGRFIQVGWQTFLDFSFDKCSSTQIMPLPGAVIKIGLAN